MFSHQRAADGGSAGSDHDPLCAAGGDDAHYAAVGLFLSGVAALSQKVF